MGFTILFLSTRLSREAYVNLLRLANCHKLVVGANFEATVKEIQEQSSLSAFDIVTKDEYDLKQPSGPRFPYVRPQNAAQQLSFVSSPLPNFCPETKRLIDNPLIGIHRLAQADLPNALCMYRKLFQRSPLQGVFDPTAVPQSRHICDIPRFDCGKGYIYV